MTLKLAETSLAKSRPSVPHVANLLQFVKLTCCLNVGGERILTWNSDAVVIDVLVNPCVRTVENKLLQFAKADCSYRFLLYAGHVVAETGSWLLQDGALLFHRFAKVFSAGCGGTGPIDVATYPEGEWNAGGLAKALKRIRLNPDKSTTSGSDADVIGITKFASALASHITIETVATLLQGTDVIGVIPFSRPTVNIFQGGNGLSAVFGVRGCSMLVDTGFPRRTCCWDFIRHMDHIDVMILPQIGENNVLGAKSFVERLVLGDVRTAIGQVFINAGQSSATGKTASDEAAAGDSVSEQSDSLLLSLNEVSSSVVECLAKSHILCAPCVAKVPTQAINLYHKIGFGSLDMYVLNPSADSKDLKDLLAGWGKIPKLRASKLSDLVSISTVIAFRPETRNDHPVRLLFPGASPIKKLYEGLDRLKSNPLFQTADGFEKSAAQKLVGGKGTARPPTGTGKQGTSRPMSSTSGRDTQLSKTVSKVTSASTAESKKTTSETMAAKARDQKTPRDAKSEPKSEGAEQKDAPTHPSTSTPKRDGPRPAARKSDVSATAAKGSTVPPAKKGPAKQLPSPIRENAKSQRGNDEKPTDAKAEIPAAKSEVKLDAAASDNSADVIPELVPCTTEQITPVVCKVDADVPTEQQENHLAESAPDSAQVSAVETAVDNEKVAAIQPAAADELAGDQASETGAEVDLIQSWDAPQSLPAPSDDKAVGSMPPTDPGSERRGAAGKSGPKQQAAAAIGKRSDRSQHQPPASARSASSATGGAKKGVPLKPVTPFYVDLAYVPTYAMDGCDAEFYRRVRARYYIIPGSSADPHQLSMLADAKSAWEGNVTVIPTGNTDALIAWVNAHHDELSSLKIEVTPSVARSTIYLDRGSACSAYRLEF